MFRSLIAALAFLCIAGEGLAQCPPDPNNSTTRAYVRKATPCPDAGTAVWSPDGSMDEIVIEVEFLGFNGLPCDTCDALITGTFTGDPVIPVDDIWVCNTNNGFFSAQAPVNANGIAEFVFTGGGCGCLHIDWTIATPCGFAQVKTGSADFCVKSPDQRGAGTVTFFSTFRLLPHLAAGFGYCSDYNCDGVVNFFDVFLHLPPLAAGATCPGSAVGPIAGGCTIACP